MKTICYYIIFACIFLLFEGCEKNDKEEKETSKYVSGDLLVGIKSDVTIDKVFKLFNDSKLGISNVGGYFYNTEFPNDSLNFIVSFIKDKPYLNKNGFKGGSVYISKVKPEIIFITDFMFDVDSIAQIDWIQTISYLKLIDYGSDTKDLLIKVPKGKEIYWRDILSKHDYISWTELNYIANLNPFP